MLVARAQVARRLGDRGKLLCILVQAEVCLLDVQARPLDLTHPLLRHDSRVRLVRRAALVLPIGAAQIGLVGHWRSDTSHWPAEGCHATS